MESGSFQLITAKSKRDHDVAGIPGVQLKSLHELIDTASNYGKLIFHLFSALAEFERNLIKERTLAGLQAARARGRKRGSE